MVENTSLIAADKYRELLYRFKFTGAVDGRVVESSSEVGVAILVEFDLAGLGFDVGFYVDLREGFVLEGGYLHLSVVLDQRHLQLGREISTINRLIL